MSEGVPPRWTAMLASMRRSSAKPHYKPVALLVALDMVKEGIAREGIVDFDQFAERFSAALEEQRSSSKAFEPFFHLSDALPSTTGAWSLQLMGVPAQFDQRPKSEGALRKRADRAVLSPALLVEFGRSRETAKAIRHAIDSMLSDLPAEDASRLRARLRSRGD